MTSAPRAIIVAWDDVVADTLVPRATALHGALRAEGHDPEFVDAMAALAGSTFAEATRSLLAARASADESLADLVTLRAARAYASSQSAAVTVLPEAVQWLRAESARGARLVLRADGARADVDALLGPLDVRDLFAFTRCSDDRAPLPVPLAAAASVVRSYAAIDARLAAIGIGMAERASVEVHPAAIDAARSYVAGTASLPR